MKSILFSLILFSFSSFADFEKVSVENLDFNYSIPTGKGLVEKVGIGLGLTNSPYEIEVTRTENSFELTSPYVDFSWLNPLKFIHDLELLSTRKMSASLGSKDRHLFEADYLFLRPFARGDYKAHKIKGECSGDAKGSFTVRMFEDCRKLLNLSLARLTFPEDFILYKVLEDMSQSLALDKEITIEEIQATIRDGDFHLQFYFKYWLYTQMKFSGHISFEDDYNVIVIRVDQVKFGQIRATRFFLNKLKEIVKNPKIKINPPWIRIYTGKMNENE